MRTYEAWFGTSTHYVEVIPGHFPLVVPDSGTVSVTTQFGVGFFPTLLTFHVLAATGETLTYETGLCG